MYAKCLEQGHGTEQVLNKHLLNVTHEAIVVLPHCSPHYSQFLVLPPKDHTAHSLQRDSSKVQRYLSGSAATTSRTSHLSKLKCKLCHKATMPHLQPTLTTLGLGGSVVKTVKSPIRGVFPLIYQPDALDSCVHLKGTTCLYHCP